LQNHAFWVVGNVRSIDALNFCWIEPGLVISDLDVAIPHRVAYLEMSDLVEIYFRSKHSSPCHSK